MTTLLPFEVTLISADLHKTHTVIAANPSQAIRIAMNILPAASGPCAITCKPGCALTEAEAA